MRLIAIPKHRISLKFWNWTSVIRFACVWWRVWSCSCNVYSELRIGDDTNKWWRDACNIIGIFVSKHSECSDHHRIKLLSWWTFHALSLFPQSTLPMWTYHIAVAFANWYCHIHKNQVTRENVEEKTKWITIIFHISIARSFMYHMCVCSKYIESASPKRMLVMPFFLFALCVISEFLPRFSNDIDNNSLALDPLLSKSIYFFFSSVLFSVTLAIYRVKLIQVIVLLHSIIVD